MTLFIVQEFIIIILLFLDRKVPIQQLENNYTHF